MELVSVARPEAEPGPQLSEATSLCTRTVVDSVGEVLGSVVDLMLDLERGCIAYAVVGSGGFMGIGERWSVVPWSDLRASGHQLVLVGERSLLDSAPSFDRDHLPLAAWWQHVHEHYRSRPCRDQGL